jgi:hypothetical protein
MCILHNFCIDGQEKTALSVTSCDASAGMMSGGFAHDIAENRPERLIDHGDI